MSEKTVWSNSLLRYGKHAVLLSNDYTFLIPECLWYPESCSPFHPGGELLKERTFTRFRLMVQTSRRTKCNFARIPRVGWRLCLFHQ